MQDRRGQEISARLAQTARPLADCRRTRPMGATIPESLWGLAVELARVHGVWRTAKTLKLDY